RRAIPRAARTAAGFAARRPFRSGGMRRNAGVAAASVDRGRSRFARVASPEPHPSIDSSLRPHPQEFLSMRAPVSMTALLVAAWARFAAAQDPSPAPTVTVPTFENATCPIMGRPSSKALFADTAHGRIYVCCPPCIGKIGLDPERAYRAAFPTTKKAGNTVC